MLFAGGKAATQLVGSREYARRLNQSPDFAKTKLA
jgi:hypothetical protein